MLKRKRYKTKGEKGQLLIHHFSNKCEKPSQISTSMVKKKSLLYDICFLNLDLAY